MRITKDRETRKTELIETSMELFLDQGYEATMVSDIVHSVGVAQGTFYYYFKTKEDVLDAVLEKLLLEGVGRAQRLAEDEYQSACQRLEGFFRMQFSPRGSVEINQRYARLLQDPAVRTRMEAVRTRMLQRSLRGLLESGVLCGEFRPMRFTGELAEIMLGGASAFLNGRRPCDQAAGAADTAMDALAECMERLLGLPEGTLDFRDKVIRRHAM